MPPHKPKRSRIAVVGSSNTDMVVRTKAIPRPGETILGGEFFMAAGGKGANQAVAAARAGGEVTFISRVGNDVFGKRAVDGFVRDGIQVDHIVRDERVPSGVALIFVAPDGENSIVVAPGANARLRPADIKRAANVISRAGILVLQLEIPLDTVTEAARLASAARVPVILNPAPAQPLKDRLLRCINVLTPNKTEAELLTGIGIRRKSDMRRAAEALLDKGIRTVLITLGASGVFAATREIMEVVPAFKVKPVDTTAAGDAFNGALAVALAENRPLFEAVRFAEAAAALSTTKPGAQPSLPKRKEIERFMG